MKRVFTTFLLLALSAAAVHARQQPATGGARLFDSFGEIQWSDWMARLDNFSIELQNNPADRGVVVAYIATHKFPGWSLRRVRHSLNYMVETRGLDASRFSVVNAGPRAEAAFELWVVPPGAETPGQPFDASLLMAGAKSPLLFDRFAVVERGDDDTSAYGLEPYPDSKGAYEYFAEVLRRDPGLRGYVVGYTSRRGARAADRRIASQAKLTIAKAYAIDPGRVVAVGGGRREFKMIDLWLVPPGAPLPKPTPHAPPSRRKRRRP